MVLLQARHCSVKSHPFPLLSPPSLLPSFRPTVLQFVLPSALPPLLHSHHPIFSARSRICAARRLLSAKREPHCHLFVHNMGTRAFADGFLVTAETGVGNRRCSFSYHAPSQPISVFLLKMTKRLLFPFRNLETPR